MSPHIYRCPLRWNDMDAQGHVNNAVYVDYLQEARVDFLLGLDARRAVTGAQLLESGVLVVGHQLEYLEPVVFGFEPIEIALWVDQVGGSRFVIGYELRDADGELAARARTAVVPYDLATNTLRRLNPAERAVLTERLAPAEPLRPLPKVRSATTTPTASRSGCAGRISTPTVTSTTSSTTTTSRKAGSR